MANYNDDLNKLKLSINNIINDGICLAFSGGADSSLILKIISDINKTNNNTEKNKIIAVTFDTKLHPKADVLLAKNICNDLNIEHLIIEVNELDNEKILFNPPSRCYHCKKHLFQYLTEIAKSKGIKYIVDGTNYDDLFEYRPGLKALKELNVISPLAENKINKITVREILRFYNMEVAKRPSSPCMATRIPYNVKIDFNILKNIENGEEYLKNLGFLVNRIRVHDNIARIEIPEKDFELFIINKNKIISKLKNLGFTYITLDLEGFRSGSMDINIKNEVT